MKKIILYSAVSGILLGISMNSIYGIPLSPLAWICLVPFILALKSIDNFRGYLLAGFIFCFSFLLISMFSFLQGYFYRRSLAHSNRSFTTCNPVYFALLFSKQTWLAKSNFNTSFTASVLGMVFPGIKIFNAIICHLS